MFEVGEQKFIFKVLIPHSYDERIILKAKECKIHKVNAIFTIFIRNMLKKLAPRDIFYAYVL